MQSENSYFFFIGTDAELIKVFPVMKELQNRNVSFSIIASGQNDITKSRILTEVLHKEVDLVLSNENDIQKSAVGLLKWFVKTRYSAAKKIKQKFPYTDFCKAIFVVHGDTISTYMGALLGEKLKAKVAHVEAGMRSHHWFNPFPEEIDRMLTSCKSDLHFAPGQDYCLNLKNKQGVVNTFFNTIIDSLNLSYKMPILDKSIGDLQNKDFFVYVIHRQENLANATFLQEATQRVLELSQKMHVVIILHKPTEIAFEKLGLLKQVNANLNVTIFHRMDYFDFMKLLYASKFVITDGGSNQQELFYMGKPTLIMRKYTESQEGVGITSKLFGDDTSAIIRFYNEYHSMERLPVGLGEKTPSQIIAETLLAYDIC